MRKFIISDIHGNGDIYDSIMGYLDNISESEEVHLFINGDLIDRGFDSFRVLMDVNDRINGKGNVHIHYLGGNHEWMMYDALMKKKPGRCVDPWSEWVCNGGYFVEGELDCREDGEELCDYFRDFMGKLKIYHVFDETVEDKPMILVHTQAPWEVLEGKELRIKDNNLSVLKALWMSKDGRNSSLFGIGRIPDHNRVGLENHFTIIGHTPVAHENGFKINEKESYINIDGGCACYAVGMFTYDHIPLLEIENGGFRILVFNHNNEIEKGFVYHGELVRMSNEELEEKRKYINHSFDGQRESYQKIILDLRSGQ